MRSYLLLLFCATLYGSNFVLGSLLLQAFPALHLSAYRLMVSSVFLLIYLIATHRLTKITFRDSVYLVPFALIGMLLHQVSFFTGLRTTDATTASLILSLAPIFTALFARLFLREPFTIRMTAGSIVALAGVFFVVGHGGSLGIDITEGIWIMFICMLALSGSIILMKKLTERMESFVATVYTTVLGCITVYPVAVWSEPHVQVEPGFWWWVLLIGSALLIQGLCAIIWNAQIRKVGAAKASLFLNLQPFVAMVLGYITLGTPVSLTQVGGSVLIICGVVLATLQGYKTRKTPDDKLELSPAER
ncbi:MULTISPECIES: DMT family transporter [Paenibacillus]|uniref:EamA family transporter n=1 Tax=Paenibacillus lautus TaxID=1401 RepID=A0A1R1B3P6_PAELA|nr:DMT family transporter [Paenibacillus lautus]OME93764.1 EamA family transporter [Paenibacillus lautus]